MFAVFQFFCSFGVTSHVPNAMTASAKKNVGASGVRNSANANALPMNGFTA